MTDLCRIRFPTENFFKFSRYYVLPHHSQTMENAVTSVLFLEFPDLHFHLNPVLDSVYITGSYRFRFYFFFSIDFAIPLSHPLFDPTIPYVAISIYVAHPFSPPAAAAAVAVAPVSPPAASPQQAPSMSFSEEEDPSKVASSSSSSFAPSSGYALADAGIANGFLSSKSI